MYRLLIVDDEAVIRQGLGMLPWKENEIEVVGILKDGIQAEEWIDSQEIDILLTDIRMPGLSGIELAKRTLQNYPEAKVILLTGYGEFEYAKEAISLGVFDYILKPSTPGEIIACVKNACEKYDQEAKTKQKLEELESKILGYSALVKPAKEILEAEEGRIGKIIKYIYENYDRELSLSVLSEEFHFTTVYMSHYIKKETGYTFLEILTSVRMYYAAKYLTETKMKNGEICSRIGISDERYFGQIFKKNYGMTPYEYRKSGSQAVNPFQKFTETTQL
ncbi:response regulator [Lacrimispora sp.]|uniref:response regulator transcription factor n=1 Tax=Lacrimispora sp. TaxID=2719234 RepID=UPI0029E4A2F6|nr:two-component system, response regulator YesN [Lacrimispora sp.]